MNDDLEKKICGLMKQAVQNQQTAGVSLLVRKDGTIVYTGSDDDRVKAVIEQLPGYGDTDTTSENGIYLGGDAEALVKQVDFKLFKLFHHASSLPKILLLYHYCFCLSVKNREKVPQYLSPVPSCHSIL